MRKTVAFGKQKMSKSFHFLSRALLCLSYGFKVDSNNLGNRSFYLFFLFISKGRRHFPEKRRALVPPPYATAKLP